MRELNTTSSVERDKEDETVFEQFPQWDKNSGISDVKTSTDHGYSTSAFTSPSANSSSSTMSLSFRLSTRADSYEKLSNGSLSDTDRDSNIETLTPLRCNRMFTFSLQDSSTSTVRLPRSPCSSQPCLDDSEDDHRVHVRSPEDIIKDEILFEDLRVAQLRIDPANGMVENIYTPARVGSKMAEQMPSTSSPLIMSSRVVASPHPTTVSSTESASSSSAASLTPSLSLNEPSPSSPTSLSQPKSPWLLLVWCHLSQILAGGLLKSMAVFLDDILQEFDSSVAFMGWMFSLEAFFFGLTCPFGSFATKKLGPRAVMMVGGLINGVGILMASLATNVIVVGVGISAIAGTGSAMIYVAALVTVRRNFRTFYAIANGLTLAGVSVAVFTFPPIIRVLITHFGWRGALSILSAISLNAMVTGALMKDGGRGRKPRSSSEDKGERKPFVSKSCNTRNQPLHENGHTEQTDTVSCTLRKSGFHKKDGSNTGLTFQTLDNLNVDCSEEKDYTSRNSCEMALHSVYIDGEVTSIATPVNADRRFYRHDRRPSTTEKYVKLIVANITHGLLGVVAFLWSMANTATMKYLVATGVQRGLSSIQSAMLLSATGIAQCLSLLINGVIISKGWMTPLQLYLVVFLIMAGAGFGIAMFQHYIVGLVCSALFGLGTGTIVSLNLVVQRTLDPRAGAQAAGWLMFIEGVAGCIGGFFMGAVRDMSGSYTLSFLVSGALTLIAACLVIVILVIRRVRRGH